MQKIKVSNKIILFLIAIMLLLPLSYYYVVQAVNELKYDAYAVKRLGFVAGSVQGLLKRNQIDTATVKDIDSALSDIKNVYMCLECNYTFFKDVDFSNDFNKLLKCWADIKMLLLQKKSPHEELLRQSDICWLLANKVALDAYYIAENKQKALLDNLFYRTIGIIIILSLLIFFVIRTVKGQLERDILYDPTTHLFNEKYFLEALERNIDLAKRHKRDLSILLFDIDDFKIITEEIGYRKADEILSALGEMLHSLPRYSDTLFHYGGERFAILAPESNIHGALILAERIHNAVKSFQTETVHSLTVSIGLAQYSTDENADNFIRRAKSLLDKAKKDKRNAIKF
jgi:diguanylate cyclase (GGDEF)-like protein